MMGVFVRVRGRRALVAGAALAAAIIGRCASGGDTGSGAANSTRSARRGGQARFEMATRLAALRLAARGTADWRIGDVPSVRVRGEVLMDGEPVAGAEVRVASSAGAVEGTAAVSDERGRFDLGYQDPLELHVVAQRGELRGERAVDLADHIAEGRAWLGVALEPCPEWTHGRLVDRDGRPLAGVSVGAYTDLGLVVEAGRSGADGRFSICARHGLASGTVLSGPDAGEVILAPPFTLRGRVLEPDGRPVDAAIVEVTPSHEFEPSATARTDRRGEWTAKVAAGCVQVVAHERGRYVRLCDPHRMSHCPPQAVEICGEPDEAVEAPPIVLPACRPPSTGVVKVGGKPAAGVVVESWFQRDLTDAEGRFSLACSSGPIQVAGHTGYVDGDETEGDLQINANPLPWIRGRVTMAGQPLRGASVRIGRDGLLGLQVVAVTARDGSWAAQVPPGTFSIAADGPGGTTTAPPDRVVVIPERARAVRIDLEMGTATAVQGSVHTADGVAAARVGLVLFPTATSPFPLAWIRSDARGFFQLAPAPGTYVLEVAHGTWRLAGGRTQIPLTVTAGGAIDLDLVVEPEPPPRAESE